jgi:hypothetical protein
MRLLTARACSSDDAPPPHVIRLPSHRPRVALDTADRFLAAMADEGIDAIADFVAAHAVLVHPYTFDGSQDPQVCFEGEDAILGYVETVSYVAYEHTDDGRTCVRIRAVGDTAEDNR